MATVEDFTDPYLETFIPVPPVTDGVCDVCHGAPNPGYTRCWSCERTISQMSRPILRVVPITLAAANRPVYDLLRKYKRPNPVLRRRLRPRVAALLAQLGQWYRPRRQTIAYLAAVKREGLGTRCEQAKRGLHPGKGQGGRRHRRVKPV